MLTPENTHHTGGGSGKYHCMDGPQSDWFEFGSYMQMPNIPSCFVDTNPVKLDTSHTKNVSVIFFLKKIGHPRPHFLYFRLFYKKLTGNIDSINVVDDWI